MSATDTTPRPPPAMSTSAIRDPIADHLITPQNSALILIDYQPSQVAAVRSMDQELLVKNAVSTVKLAKLFGVPIVQSTVNVASGRVGPTVTELAELREGYEVYSVVDAVGGTSVEAHRAGLERVTQAGGHPITWVSLACELQRDWAREDTVPEVVQIVLTERLLQQ